jgi:hypothetical protein
MLVRFRGAAFVLPAATLLAALLVTACDAPCRTDLDCPTDEGLTRCEPASATCTPLLPNAPAVCEDHGECVSGRLCVERECRFAPSCQTFVEGAIFSYRANCLTAGERTGVARPIMNGCQVTFTFEELYGDQALILEPISAIEAGDPALHTTGTGVLCGAGVWSSPRGGALLRACILPGNDICDIALLRGEGDLCRAEADCAPAGVCKELLRVQDATAGVCG